MPGLIDWILAALLFVIVPFLERNRHLKVRAEVESGSPDARIRTYRGIILWEWVALAVVIGTLVWRGLDVGAVGIRWSGGASFWLAAVLCGAALSYLVWQLRAVRSHERLREQALRSIGELDYFLPKSPRELRFFDGVSVTAGVVEELLYRGYLIWLFAAVMPLWGAVLASSALFGYGHMYQGPKGMIKIAFVGALLGGLYVLSSSIWLPIMVHAAGDMLQGRVAYEVTGRQDTGPAGPSPEAAPA